MVSRVAKFEDSLFGFSCLRMSRSLQAKVSAGSSNSQGCFLIIPAGVTIPAGFEDASRRDGLRKLSSSRPLVVLRQAPAGFKSQQGQVVCRRQRQQAVELVPVVRLSSVFSTNAA